GEEHGERRADPAEHADVLEERLRPLAARYRRYSSSVVGRFARSRSTLAAKSSASVVWTTCSDAFRFARSRRLRASAPTLTPSRAPSRGHSAPTTTATASAS